MKRKFCVMIAALAFVFFVVAMRTAQVSAQQPTPIPGEPLCANMGETTLLWKLV